LIKESGSGGRLYEGTSKASEMEKQLQEKGVEQSQQQGGINLPVFLQPFLLFHV
jgi:hypothetical protein